MMVVVLGVKSKELRDFIEQGLGATLEPSRGE